MKTVRRRWDALLGCVVLAIESLASFHSRAETPPGSNVGDSGGFISSVLLRDDSVFAATNIGLYRAALSDKVWHKLPLPSSASLSAGYFGRDAYLAREAAPSLVLVYYRPDAHQPPELSNGRALVMYVSKNLGQTWKLVSTGRRFSGVFIHSDGGIYADEEMLTPTPPPHPDKEPSAWTGDDEGQKLYAWHRVVVSHDLGKTWRDISDGLPSGYVYSISPSLDHPDLIRVSGVRNRYTKGGASQTLYEADDQTYHWKEVSWQAWRKDPGGRECIFCSPCSLADRTDLSTLLKYPLYPFLKEGDPVMREEVQIETEKSAYTFRQHEPMPVALKAYFVLPHKPVQFADNEDEAIYWVLRGYAEDGDTFLATSKAAAPDDKSVYRRDDPGTRAVMLDYEHPYRRTVDLAKLYDFPGPGKYRVQPMKEYSRPSKRGNARFTGQVIDVTITP